MRDLEEVQSREGQHHNIQPPPVALLVEKPREVQTPDLNLLQTGELTRPRRLDEGQQQWQVRQFNQPTVQLELPLRAEAHLKRRTKLLAVELTRLRLKRPAPKPIAEIWAEQVLGEEEPREVREPSRFSEPPPQVDDPTAVIEVRNEMTGQAWRFRDIGSMYDSDGMFSLRGQWPPGLYRIENRTNASLKLTLWNETHAIMPGETWRFLAHSELGRKAELIERRRMN